MPFGNAGDQIGGPSQRQRGRKAADDRDDLPFQPERLQGFVDRSRVEALPRDEAVPPRRITGGRAVTLVQPVPPSNDATEALSQKSLHPHLRTSGLLQASRSPSYVPADSARKTAVLGN